MAIVSRCVVANCRSRLVKEAHWRAIVAGLPVVLLCMMPSASWAQDLPADVLLIGDSITFGAIFVPDGGPGFEALLPDLLTGDFRVINAGSSGASSQDSFDLDQPVLCRGHGWVYAELFETVVAPHLPVSIATILLGTNDAKGYDEPERVLAVDYARAIDELIAELFDRGVGEVVVMTPAQIKGSPAATIRASEYRDYLLEKCSSHEEIHCGPDLYVELDTGLHFADSDVHPNSLGHQVIASELADSVLAIPLPEPQRQGVIVLGTLCLISFRRKEL